MVNLWKNKRTDYEIMNDEQLCLAIFQGDDGAFDYLYEEWKDRLYSYIWTFLNYNDEDALNVTSDVFVKLYKYLKQKSVTNLKPFLYKIARNESINLISSRKSENIKEYESTILESLVTDPEFKSQINEQYRSQILKSFLQSLDSNFREVLYLYYFEGKDYMEIAQIISSNKNTVGTIISRGKAKLKELIETAGYSNVFTE
ncbi:MAG: RNA polymerase sigma factor [Candidatus Absconditabacteria bacterium]